MIGGGAVYAAFLPHADRLVVTEVDLDRRRRHLGPRDRSGLAARPTRTPAEGWSASATGLRLRGRREYGARGVDGDGRTLARLE